MGMVMMMVSGGHSSYTQICHKIMGPLSKAHYIYMRQISLGSSSKKKSQLRIHSKLTAVIIRIMNCPSIWDTRFLTEMMTLGTYSSTPYSQSLLAVIPKVVLVSSSGVQ